MYESLKMFALHNYFKLIEKVLKGILKNVVCLNTFM